MEITFLGGAKEVGASSVLVKTAGKNILIDAGIKVNEDGTEALPDLSILERLREEEQELDAVIISHAHLDHCGALPVVNRIFPNTRIYCTLPTKTIMQVMLEDALKVARATTGLVFYEEEDIDRVIRSTATVPYESSYSIDDNVSFVLLQAGHVLGAAGILIQSSEGTLLYTGDFTVTEQRTIEEQKMTAFLKDGVNIIISEGTYGGKTQHNREKEIEKLIKAIEETVENGGRVLIPAFALGRAQEVLLAIKDRKKKGYNVYADGLIRTINTIYENHNNYLTKRSYRESRKSSGLFYTDEIVEVKDKKQREKLMDEKGPYVIVASSGMLTGGLSPVYAEKIIDDKKSSIIIVGYQDEESPGRQLLNLAENKNSDRKITLNGIEKEVKCRIEKAQLSAHASGKDIVLFLESIPADHIYLVHGEEEALTELAEELKKSSRIKAHIEIAEKNKTYSHKIPPANIKKYSFAPHTEKFSLNRGVEDEINTELLWKHLVEHGFTETEITTGDLMTIWYGTENLKNITERDKTAFLRAVAEDKQHFEISYDKTQVYIKAEDKAAPQRMDQASAREFLKEKLGKYDFKTASFIESEGKAVLILNTFKYINKIKEMLPELEEKILWKIEIRPTPDWMHVKALIKNKFAEEKIQLLGEPSDAGDKIIVRVEEDEEIIRKAEKLAEELSIETGIKVLLDNKSSWIQKGFPKSIKRAKPHEIKPLVDKIINSKISHPDFRAKPGMDQNNFIITLKFVTPQYGERFKKEIEVLKRESGWEVKIHPHSRTDIIIPFTEKILKNHNIERTDVSWHGTYIKVKIPAEFLENEELKKKIEEELTNLFASKVVFEAL